MTQNQKSKIKNRKSSLETHKFRNKLILNQWLISLFGVDPLFDEYRDANGHLQRPFNRLTASIKDPRLEGLDHDNLHRFYRAFTESEFFWGDHSAISKEQLLRYDENIVRHTLAINEKRERSIVWKYYQWLSLVFTEIYLDRYFRDPAGLLADLNDYVAKFNQHYRNYADIPEYSEDDLNKICLQNATGSGKTLLMHVNLLQFKHYAEQNGHAQDLSRIILITPNKDLGQQHLADFQRSGIPAEPYLETRGSLYGGARGLERVDVMEITTLADEEGPNTVATRSLGDQNLLLVDEGHRGLSGKEEGTWLKRRADLCAKGFTFEYSATFEQAVASAGNIDTENNYAKSVLFDYSYRWFYEDGFGKDYQILNLPASLQETQSVYLTACLLKFYQQLRIYEEKKVEFQPFNLEKPLWVFVGSTVSKAKGGTRDEKTVATDVAQIVQFIADFLADASTAQRRIDEILTGTGQDTGLLDAAGNDIFARSFLYLQAHMNAGDSAQTIYRDILRRVFNNAAGGHLQLQRIKGESGEVALTAGASDEPFGLINVGDAKGLTDHLEEVAIEYNSPFTVEESDFTEAMFATVKESSSPVNLLIGSKKFIEGWDCWRVSTMGLMHVGRSEGTQIIQLFGRGVRLKGYNWTLKRSGHARVPLTLPPHIDQLETLNVFGIQADFMEKFRDFLKEEGLPGNEIRRTFTIPLNVTYDFGKRLLMLRPKIKGSDGQEYDFKRDAAVPTLGDVPDYLQRNPVKSDWYPRIQAISSRKRNAEVRKEEVKFYAPQLALLNFDQLYFELEQFKREKSWHNLNISKAAIRQLLADPSWYTLYMPTARMQPTSFDGVRILQQVASDLLKRYCDHFYNYCKRAYLEPRLELRELTSADENFPVDSEYQLIVDGSDTQVIQSIERISRELAQKKGELLSAGDLRAIDFDRHLYQPLFHVRNSGKITVLPVSLNESEYQFVDDLVTWYKGDGKKKLTAEQLDLYLMRNMSRGRGAGFFEAGNFYPDFILWAVNCTKQYVTFIEPHGLQMEGGPDIEKVHFAKRIKQIQARLNHPDIVLNSFVLSWTPYPRLNWGLNKEQLAEQHVLFMTEDRLSYVQTLMDQVLAAA
jgi:superfamily II DNA or RNA helicase